MGEVFFEPCGPIRSLGKARECHPCLNKRATTLGNAALGSFHPKVPTHFPHYFIRKVHSFFFLYTVGSIKPIVASGYNGRIGPYLFHCWVCAWRVKSKYFNGRTCCRSGGSFYSDWIRSYHFHCSTYTKRVQTHFSNGGAYSWSRITSYVSTG